MVAAVRWGILGPGAIARSFATAIDGLEGHEVVAAGSRDPERALAFNAERGYTAAEAGTYRDLVRSESVDAVYVASPHPGHLEHAALALRHGKAVLCEKPLCVNASEARRLCAIASERGRPLLEAMWTRFLPATLRAAEWVANGTIGEPSRVVCSFGFHTQFNPESRLYDPELAGGSLLDVGCYTLSLAALVFGDRMTGGEIPQLEVRADLAPSGVDQHCKVVLRFGDGAEAYLESSISRATSATAVIQGDGGRILIPDFWRAQTLKLECETQEVASLECPFLCNGYEYQALEIERMLRDGDVESPLLPHAESIALIELMDEIRRRIGVHYPFESSVGVTAGTHRAMTYRPFAAPARDLPRLVLGTMVLDGDTSTSQGDADALLDAAFENGICAVDTGHVYGGGASERADRIVARAPRSRGRRLRPVQGLPPRRGGDHASTRRHWTRTSPSRSTGCGSRRSTSTCSTGTTRRCRWTRWSTLSPEQLAAGRLRAYGLSNWTRARIEEARDYAEANDRPLPAASSPNFSLADQVRDPWGGGCVTLTGAAAADDRDWHRRTGMAIFAWSSLARGLFSGRVTRRALAAEPGLVDDACRAAYVHEVNLARLDRVIEFAEAGGASVPQIALAWVLAQDLPLHAIVGAATQQEVEDLAAAVALSLTDEEEKWLRSGGRRPHSMARESLAMRLERQAIRIGRRLPGPIKRPIKRLVGRA